jgi:hypothetical protein
MSVPGTARLIAASGFGEPRFGEESGESARGPPLRDGGFGARTLPSPTFADGAITLAGLTSRGGASYASAPWSSVMSCPAAQSPEGSWPQSWRCVEKADRSGGFHGYRFHP